MVWAAIAFQSSTASALAEIAPASNTASVIRMSFCFIVFGFFLFYSATSAWFVVTGPRRFSAAQSRHKF
jgi:Mn2+/Fe2+ NRAMP family transporter